MLFAAMAALLVTSLTRADVSGSWPDARARGRCAGRPHRALSSSPVANDPALRQAVAGLAISTAIGVGILVAGSLRARPAVRSGPRCFLLRHGRPPVHRHQRLAARRRSLRRAPRPDHDRRLGRVDRGDRCGSEAGVDGGVIVAAILGIAVVCALWWAAPNCCWPIRDGWPRSNRSKERNALALAMRSRTSTFRWWPRRRARMKTTLAHVGDPLNWPTATARSPGAPRCNCSVTSRSSCAASVRSASCASSPPARPPRRHPSRRARDRRGRYGRCRGHCAGGALASRSRRCATRRPVNSSAMPRSTERWSISSPICAAWVSRVTRMRTWRRARIGHVDGGADRRDPRSRSWRHPPRRARERATTGRGSTNDHSVSDPASCATGAVRSAS